MEVVVAATAAAIAAEVDRVAAGLIAAAVTETPFAVLGLAPFGGFGVNTA